MKQQLETRIRELVPSLMELPYSEIEISELEKELNSCVYVEDIREAQYDLSNAKEENRRFLGHPIQLHHVLQSLKKVDNLNTFVDIKKDRLQFETWVDDIDDSKTCYWDLTKPLEGQSDEVINFLSEILK